eukprot:765956-Hanusia_phi.AAC.3
MHVRMINCENSTLNNCALSAAKRGFNVAYLEPYNWCRPNTCPHLNEYKTDRFFRFPGLLMKLHTIRALDNYLPKIESITEPGIPWRNCISLHLRMKDIYFKNSSLLQMSIKSALHTTSNKISNNFTILQLLNKGDSLAKLTNASFYVMSTPNVAVINWINHQNTVKNSKAFCLKQFLKETVHDTFEYTWLDMNIAASCKLFFADPYSSLSDHVIALRRQKRWKFVGNLISDDLHTVSRI